ncbi:hypothetical protein CFP65_2774 [Kitasatospora sp. MMS16-BH015]|uniref:hypothetical protein n=1 Tax=Kitasatospora sp. MMS16-BH015 TaxID=2018025 RepID=UPI000CA19F00|nr:hypothetical protein [Kitasatospora sp. MMS16-BH015]AUG77593.1 hypothetical protein CFP65_2774 [Kitasatospora sp. MMS16-BH015]
MDTHELRAELDAAVQTRKELGKEYEAEVIDSFLTKLDAQLDVKIDSRLAAEEPRRKGGNSPQQKLQGLSLMMAIPLSGIAGGTGGLTGLIVCWAGIVGVNLASALKR